MEGKGGASFDKFLHSASFIISYWRLYCDQLGKFAIFGDRKFQVEVTLKSPYVKWIAFEMGFILDLQIPHLLGEHKSGMFSFNVI